MTLARAICLLSAAVCILVGAWSLAAPDGVARMIGYAFTGPDGAVEFMTVYGGFYLGLGLFLAVAARWTRWLEAALAMSTFAATGAMLARLAGYLALAPAAGITLTLLLSEIAWAAVSALGWRLAARG